MEIKIRIINFYDEKEEEYLCKYTQETTIYEAFESIGSPLFELKYSNYYDFGYQCCNSSVHYGYFQIPYVITEKKVMWMPSYKDIKLIDFIRMVGYPEEIEAYTDIPSGGSLMFNSIPEMWEYYTPILNNIVLIVTFSHYGVKFGSWLKGKLLKTIPPLPLIDFINRRQAWNPYELGKLLKVSSSEAKYILKGLAYKYDNSNKMYIKTLRTDEIMNGIKEIPWEGDGE